MAKPANPNQNAQNVHANQPGGAIDAHLDHYDITYSLNGTVDSEAVYNGPGGPDMYWGHGGNSAAGYHIADNNTLGIELALKEHVRNTGPDEAHTGDASGVADATAPGGLGTPTTHGTQTSMFNFDYVVDTGLNGSTHTLSDFTFKIQITQTATDGATNTQVWDLNPTTHVWTNEANPASFFGGDDFAHPASDLVKSQVAENSENLGFLGGVFGPMATATLPGTQYDIQLEAFKGPQLVDLVHDHLLLT